MALFYSLWRRVGLTGNLNRDYWTQHPAWAVNPGRGKKKNKKIKSKQRKKQGGLEVRTVVLCSALCYSEDKPPFRWGCRSLIYPEHRCEEIAPKTFWRTLSLASLHDQKDPPKENRSLGVYQNGVPQCLPLQCHSHPWHICTYRHQTPLPDL